MMTTVVSGGVRLAVSVEGDPALPTVILIHGYPDTHRIWDGVAASLAGTHRVVRYDTRGAGASDAPRGLRAYRLDRLADDLFAVITAVSPDRAVHVAAHDWGSVQAWEAVTDPRAVGRIAGYTSISGPCLDHIGRARTGNGLRSWYIAAFHLPFAPLVWRLGLARAWPRLLRRLEGVVTEPAPTLAADAAHGIRLYRANMLPRMVAPRERRTAVPVRLIVLALDRYISPKLFTGIEDWAPNLHRRDWATTHWGPLLKHPAETAAMIAEFTNAQA